MAPRSSRRGPFAVGFLGPEQRQLLTILLERLFDSNRIHSTVQSGAPQTTEQPTTESGRIHLLDTGSPVSAPRLNAVGASSFHWCRAEIVVWMRKKCGLPRTSLQCKLVRMKNNLQDFLERPKRYDNIDGTGEMFMGLMMLGFAAISFLQPLLPRDSLWNRGLFGLLFMYAVLAPFFAAGFFLQRVVKKHWTWLRTGYAAFPCDAKAKRSGMLAGAGLGAVVGAVIAMFFAIMMVVSRHHTGAVTMGRVVYLGFWAPLYAFWIYRMSRDMWWKWMLAGLMAVGLATIGWTAPGGWLELGFPTALFVGAVWLASGAITLLEYLRTHRPPSAEAA